MDPRPCLATLLIAASCLHIQAQKTFNLGMKVGLGASAFPLNAAFDSNDYTGGVRPMTIFTTGILAQYMINARMGIESGTHFTHYGYYKNETSAWQNLTGEEPIIQLIDYQVPVALLYRIEMPSNPFKYVMLNGGTSVDWVTIDELIPRGKTVSIENLYCGVRIGREKVSGSRIECGLEFQYSFKRFYLKGVNYNQEEKLSTRLSLLALNFYYFFWNQPLTKVEL